MTQKIEGFTPGPWKVVEDPGSLTHGIYVTDADPNTDDFRGFIGYVSQTNLIGEYAANAALIAQAPTLYAENERLRAIIRDLLDNSQAFYSAIEMGHGYDGEAWETRARAALNQGDTP